jgi:thiamine kinase-like enzyme
MKQLVQDISKPRHPESDPLPMTGLQITKGRNLLSLLALDSESPILIVGKGLGTWKGVFPQAQYCTTIHSIPNEPEKYDLVLLDCSSAGSTGDLVHVLVQIERRMSGKGAFILLARNRFSFERMKGLIKPVALSRDEHTYSYSQIMNAATGALFPHIRAFLPFSGGEAVQGIDEMVAPDSRFLEIPHYSNPIKKIAHSIGKYYLIHDSFAILCTHNPLSHNRLFEEIKTSLEGGDESGKVALHLERFDIRDRGALVLFLKTIKENKPSYVVTRVVHDLRKREVIKKNHDFLKYLYSIKGLSKSFKTKLPTPLSDFSFKKGHVFIETLIPGTLAWKANNTKIAKKILKDAQQFSLHLSQVTGCRTCLDKKVLDDLFREDERRINESRICSESFKRTLIEEIATIKNTVAGQYMWLAAAHGDYGYGNILVDPSDGRLNGVIDWDTARAREFPAVDLINMGMQRRRIEQRMSIEEAINDVVKTCLENGGEKEGFANIDHNIFTVLAHISLIRDISRSLLYPDLFLMGQEEQLQALSALKQNYPLVLH